MKRYAYWAGFLLLLAGCTTPPKQYVAPSIVSSLTRLPVYADLSNQQRNVQDMLIKRGLILDNQGMIAPLDTGSCGYPLVTRIKSNSLRQQALPFQYKLVSLQKQDGEYVFIPGDDEPQILAVLNQEPGSYLYDLTAINPIVLVLDWKRNFSQLRNPVLLTKPQSKLFVSSPIQSRNIFIATHNNTAQHIQYLRSKDKSRTLVLTNVDALRTCQALGQTSMIGLPLTQDTRSALTSTVALLSLLPTDADFNQVEKQRVLISRGRYLTFTGKTAILVDRCSTVNGTNNDFRCRDSADDRRRKQAQDVIIFGGQHGS